jgi:transcriptional regulator with XRE-family HTH domain
MTLAAATTLGDFLRAHRERMTPEAAGLPAGIRRRTPGLRREELAMLCGISLTWYTWMEQGRDISVSASALARLAVVLRLNQAERAYLFDLAQKRDPASAVAQERAVAPPALIAAINAMTMPAYLLDRAWNASAWNHEAEALFGGWLDGPDRNLLRFIFLDASARALICDWPDRARRVLAEFRADAGRHLADPAIGGLVAALRRDSAFFASCWDEHAVLSREGGMRSFQHPRRGRLNYEQITLTPSGAPDFKLVMLLEAKA